MHAKPLDISRPRAFRGCLLLAALSSFSCKSAGGPSTAGGPPAAEAAPAAAQNPVQHEMLLLTAALSNALSGIGRGDVSGIRHDLHRVHTAKDATSASIRDGGYKPPRGADQLERFVELDEAFHKHLERLVAASRKNDVPAAAEALADAVRGCHGCHAEFRDTPAVESPPQ